MGIKYRGRLVTFARWWWGGVTVHAERLPPRVLKPDFVLGGGGGHPGGCFSETY